MIALQRATLLETGDATVGSSLTALGVVSTPRFDSFLQDAEKVLQSTIEFNTMENCTVKVLGDVLGCSNPASINPLKVYTNVTLMHKARFSGGSIETGSAHEVLHKWLIAESFPCTATSPTLAGSERSKLAGRLHGAIHHISIDKRLAEYGFAVSDVNAWQAKTLIERLKWGDLHYCSPGQERFISETLFYIEAGNRYGRDAFRTIKDIFYPEIPLLVYTGNRCLQIIKETDCTTPPGALEALTKVRDELGLQDQRVYDPITKRYV